ncbi:MAG TPA: alanine--glyoxylate aminotransferase family protein, partial [Methylomirabilota bacterium]|nr:alanine--glyoxylate aminotransferase family protein [Methylomirabilota bacterium]
MAAMQRPMIPHRGAGFKALYRELLRLARLAHRTDGDVFTWPASGSAGWEVAVVNLLSPGDPVLAAVNGDFGARFARVAVAFGLDVRRLEAPWGRAITPEMLREALTANPAVKAVFLVHNETSTGLTNPLPELAAIVRDHGALVVVDSVSGVGGLPLEMDAWGIDFVLSGSQKAWMCPPGLLIAAVGPRAWSAVERSTFPKAYWDLRANRKAAAEGMTPTTPALSLLYAYFAALEQIMAEGIERVWARHARLGDLVRAGTRAIGLDLYADREYASNTVTAIRMPASLTARDLVEAVRREHGVELGAGQGAETDAMIRIGHMGWVEEPELRRTLDGLSEVLDGRGWMTA